jgi:hypothetical protein
MKARKQPVKAQKSAQVTTTCNLPDVVIPPRVAALAVFAADNEDGMVPKRFRLAWERMPAMVAQMVDGEGWSSGGVTRSNTIRAIFQREVEQAKAGHGYEHLPRSVELLNTYHDDAMTHMEIGLGETGFYVGLALALYLSEGGR